MNLSDALTAIADFLSLDADRLREYAEEDWRGGFHTDPAQATFPGGSLWGVEGQTLYALVRALNPAWSLELGTWHGASTTHLLAAIDMNCKGELTSVDWWEGAGTLVPQELYEPWNMIYMEGVQFLQGSTMRKDYGFVYEDMIHSDTEVKAVCTALLAKLPKGAVVVHHDSEHGDDGEQIRRALTRAGVHWRSWLIDPADCGLAIWRNE